MEKKKVWLWKAYDPIQGKILAWHLGGRNDRSLRKLIDKLGGIGPHHRFVADDWAGYHRLIPENQLFTGKDLTFLIESDNARTRRNLARFHRKTQASSRALHMVESSLALAYDLINPESFKAHLDVFQSMIS